MNPADRQSERGSRCGCAVLGGVSGPSRRGDERRSHGTLVGKSGVHPRDCIWELGGSNPQGYFAVRIAMEASGCEWLVGAAAVGRREGEVTLWRVRYKVVFNRRILDENYCDVEEFSTRLTRRTFRSACGSRNPIRILVVVDISVFSVNTH